MNQKLIKVSPFILTALYFILIWTIPWPVLDTRGIFSTSYLFEIVLCLVGFSVHKSVFMGRPLFDKKFINRTIIIFAYSMVFCVIIFKLMKLITPFTFLQSPIIQLLIIAPILEELFFRYTLINIFKKFSFNDKQALFFSSIIFAVSHFIAIFYLETVFKNFIILQTIYTFLLGYICGAEYLRQKSMIPAFIFHFLFNLIFYFWITA
jgi:membrane protease YdiL (CAAX protease family)